MTHDALDKSPAGSTRTGMRASFRETLWFKKGMLDAELAQSSTTGPTRVDTLPLEDRYLEDGTLSPSDSLTYGLAGGTTQPLRVVRLEPDAAADESRVPERALVAEMKTGRRIVLAMVAVGLALVAGGATLMIS